MGLENARDYYGKVLGGTQDLRTDACATAEAPSAAVRAALSHVHEKVRARYYGTARRVLIQRRPMRIRGAIPCRGGSQCFQTHAVVSVAERRSERFGWAGVQPSAGGLASWSAVLLHQASSLVSTAPLCMATCSVLLLLISYCGSSGLAWWMWPL
jgi:hypothetical protein